MERLEGADRSVRLGSDANGLEEMKGSMLDASGKCNLKKKKERKSAGTEPWFDDVCAGLKRDLASAGKRLRSDHGNMGLRNELFELKRKLKRTVRKKKMLHKKMVLAEMARVS